MLEPSGQAQHSCNHLEAVRIEAIPVDKLRDGDVTFSGKSGKQIKSLKYKTNFVPAQPGAFSVAHGGQLIAVDQHRALGSLRHSANYVKKRRFAASGRPHDRDRFTGLYLEIHATQSGDFHFARVIELPQIFRFEYRFQYLFLEIRPFGRLVL